MIIINPEIGFFALCLALSLSMVQAVLPLWGTATHDRPLMASAVPLALWSFAAILTAFLVLTVSYVQSDFSVENVYMNSHSAKP